MVDNNSLGFLKISLINSHIPENFKENNLIMFLIRFTFGINSLQRSFIEAFAAEQITILPDAISHGDGG